MGTVQMRMNTNAAIAIGTVCLLVVVVTAIAHQEFSWWVFPFSILFGTIFLGVLGLCFLSYRDDKYRSASVDAHPHEPWMWDERWCADIMISRSRAEFWGTIALTIIVGMIALGGTASLFLGLAEGNLWVLLNLIPIAAAAYFGRNTYVAWRTLRFERHVTLLHETRPAWIGDSFSALMETAAGHHPEHVEAWLEHFKIIRHEDSDGTSFEKVVERRVSGRVEDIVPGKARIVIDIPQKSPATSWTEDEQSRWWDLVISMRVSGVEIPVRYEIPVAEPTKHQNSGA